MCSVLSKKDDITILVNSCDLYEDAWYPFFKLLQIQWENCPYDVVLHTETKVYDCDFMNVRTICTGKEKSWTARLRDALLQIDSEYILFFLEDFFLLKKVETDLFSRAVEIIKNDKRVGLVHYVPAELSMPEISEDLENYYYELPVRKRTLRTRVVVSLFRKEYLLRLLYADENPWQYERESHIRSMFAGYKIIRPDYSKSPPTFYYILDHANGIGITARKWLPGNKAFFESMGIYDVNYARLGVHGDEEKRDGVGSENNENIIAKSSFKQRFYDKITHPIKRRIRHVWFLQDIMNIKKYLKYWNYYRKMDKMQ